MKRLLFITFVLFASFDGFSQAYIPMPTDSAVWRYRMFNYDYEDQVMDCILFLNGTDTIAHGITYHTIMSRAYNRVVPHGYVPPVVPISAGNSDLEYGGIRESGKKVFLLNISGEQLIYDYNAVVGDSIPAYSGKKVVTAIDSVLLGSGYHKRFLTTDTAYYVIEGIGSSEGLIPGLNDGSGTVEFMCFTDTPVTYSPDTTVPCTYVYPFSYLSVYNVNETEQDIKIFPVPVNNILHITFSGSSVIHAIVLNSIGQVMWKGEINNKQDIPVASWSKGIYFMRFTDSYKDYIVRKIIVQ